ncbi:Probable phospholipid hydroperoxide glutathione peroxidase 6, mitochondrial [Linum grandiflorum]
MLCSSIRNLSRKNLIFASSSASSLLRTRPLRSVSSLGFSGSRLPHRRSVSLKQSPILVSCSARFDRAMASNSEAPQSIYDFTVKDARGNDVDLSTYKGKVLLIVNVASQCGLTNSNYTELTELYKKYKDQGLEILAFPCNQFGSQEPGTNEQIMEFACTRFKAEYPIFDKVDVNGNNAAPIYKFLKSSKGGLFGDGIKWNFAKFLINKEGQVVDRYAPTTSPLSFEKDVKKLLGVA